MDFKKKKNQIIRIYLSLAQKHSTLHGETITPWSVFSFILSNELSYNGLTILFNVHVVQIQDILTEVLGEKGMVNNSIW